MIVSINGKTYEAGELVAYVKELEKENAELKKLKRECETSICRAEYQYNYEQLTKAKHYIKELVRAVEHSYSVLSWQRPPIKAEAEQFLSEADE